MSRHRIVRSMNYEDEFYDDDDEYSRSVEDNYCISPSTAAQFTWNREKNVNFAAYMGEGEVINEEEEEETEEEGSLSRHDSLSDSSQAARLRLSDIEKAQLNSCLEEARNILGESVPEAVLVDVIIQNGFNLETAVNQMLCQQDAPKPQREPRQRRNRSQDDIDSVELDNLLAEIQGLESSHSSVFSQDGLRFTSAVLQSEQHESEDSHAGDTLEVISNQLHDVSVGDKTLTSVYDKAKSVSNQSKSEQVKDSKSSKQTINQKLDAESNGANLSKTSHTQQPVKISLADLAKNSSEKAPNSSKTNQNIPFKNTGSSYPSEKEVENKSKPKQVSAVSLSDLVKQTHSEKGSKQSTGKNEQAKDKETGLSLAELTRQHKAPSLSVKSSSAIQSPALTSNAQRAHDGMASLSALVAQHSAQKKGTPDKSTSVFDSHIPVKKSSTPSGNSTVPLSIPLGGTSAQKSSLSDLAKAHAQSGKSSNISLSQLAAQHRQLTPPSASTSPMSAMQNLGKPSMSSLLKNLTLEESESKPASSRTTNTLSTSPSSGMPSGLSLSSCLKTTKTSSNKADNIKPPPFKSKHKEYFQEDSPSDEQLEPEVMPNPMLSRSLSNADVALLSDASTLGMVLCCIKRKRKQKDFGVSDSKRPMKYPKFMCLAQVSNRKLYADCVLRDITPFNFSSPSPDDVVRNKQKQAFTRSDKEFVV